MACSSCGAEEPTVAAFRGGKRMILCARCYSKGEQRRLPARRSSNPGLAEARRRLRRMDENVEDDNAARIERLSDDLQKVFGLIVEAGASAGDVSQMLTGLGV
jgi:hypothetical protein